MANSVSFSGAWKDGETAGGCANFPSVHTSPQYFLTVTKTSKVNLTLEQTGDGQLMSIGIAVCDKKGEVIKALYKGEKIAGSGQFKNDKSVSTGEITLEAQDYPYTVLASTYQPGDEQEFTMTCTSNAPVIFKETGYVNPFKLLPYMSPVFKGSWVAGSTAGGCANFATVKDNPQFFVEVKQPTHSKITLKQGAPAGGQTLKSIGVTVLDKKGDRILCVYKSDFVASSGPVTNRQEVHCDVLLEPRDYPYTVYVTTFNPNEEADFEFWVDSDALVSVSEVPPGDASHKYKTCAKCGNDITGNIVTNTDGSFHVECVEEKICPKCNQEIVGKYYNALGGSYHVTCFVCAACSKPLGSNFTLLNGAGYCGPECASPGATTAGVTEQRPPSATMGTTATAAPTAAAAPAAAAAAPPPAYAAPAASTPERAPAASEAATSSPPAGGEDTAVVNALKKVKTLVKAELLSKDERKLLTKLLNAEPPSKAALNIFRAAEDDDDHEDLAEQLKDLLDDM